MKKLMNLKGVKALNRKQQKAINGGSAVDPCCSGRPNGSSCYITCHSSCPKGICSSGNCAVL